MKVETFLVCRFICNELFDGIEAEIAVQRGSTRPTGTIHLTNENATLDTDWQTASGTGTYPGKLFFSRLVSSTFLTNKSRLPCLWNTLFLFLIFTGFAMAALLSYKNLKISGNKSFEELKGSEKDGVDPSFQIFSRVVSVVVSNPSTQNLSRSVNITLRHLEVAPPVFHVSPFFYQCYLF